MTAESSRSDFRWFHSHLISDLPRFNISCNRALLDQPKIDIGALCTICEVALGVITIILSVEGPSIRKKTTNFGEVLKKWERTWMWENLWWVGEDHWITEAIEDGTLIAVMDGSYMKDLYPNIHLAALVLECTRGRGCLWCSFAEVSKSACSYRGELVGLMAIHLSYSVSTRFEQILEDWPTSNQIV